MAIFTRAELKDFMMIDSSVTTEDAVLDFVVTAADAEVKHVIGSDVEDAGSVSARVYVPEDDDCCIVDYFSTTTGLIVKSDTNGDGTFATTLTLNTDFEVLPRNGKRNGQTFSYYELRTLGGTDFVVYEDRPATVQVTARWGWTTVPGPIKYAALVYAASDERVRALVRGEGGFTRWSREHAMAQLADYVHPFGVRVA